MRYVSSSESIVFILNWKSRIDSGLTNCLSWKMDFLENADDSSSEKWHVLLLLQK